MTSLRLLAGGALAVALAGFTAGLLHADAGGAPPAVQLPRAAIEPQAEPLPPAVVPDAARPRVPAAILARAASARALDRGPVCPPGAAVAAPAARPRCAPEQRESIEIEWNVEPADP